MRKSTLCLLFIVGATVLIGSSGHLRAAPPDDITVTVDFGGKDYFDIGEAVPATVTITNTSSTNSYWINKKFFSMDLYLEMQLIDPAGRVLLPTRNDLPEVPDAPPLPFILSDGFPVQVTDCQALGPSQSISSTTDDLRKYFQMKYSGPYSARVDLSSMTFKPAIGDAGDQCDINNYEWLGLLKSETKYIYTQGSTEVDIIPKYWLTFWKKGMYLVPDIAVAIWPEVGKTVNDYRADQIKLNDVSPKKVVKMYSILKKSYYLLAFFDKKKSINSLGPVVAGQWYPVVISGVLTTDQYFGGGQKVKIVEVP